MKTIIWKIFIILSLFLFTSCNFDNAWEHNDKIITIVDKSTDSYDNYSEKTQTEDIETLWDLYNKEIENQNSFFSEISEIKPYNTDNTELIDAWKELIETRIFILKKEEKELLDLWKTDWEWMEEEEYKNKQDELFDTIYEKLDSAWKIFDEKQAKFAKEHWYEIEE